MQLRDLCLLSTYSKNTHQILAILLNQAVPCGVVSPCAMSNGWMTPKKWSWFIVLAKLWEREPPQSLGHYSSPHEDFFFFLLSSFFGANCTRHESYKYIKQLVCLYQCVLIQYVEFMEIWNILCQSLLWYLLKLFWITFVIKWLAYGSRAVSMQLCYSPMFVFVVQFF